MDWDFSVMLLSVGLLVGMLSILLGSDSVFLLFTIYFYILLGAVKVEDIVICVSVDSIDQLFIKV